MDWQAYQFGLRNDLSELKALHRHLDKWAGSTGLPADSVSRFNIRCADISALFDLGKGRFAPDYAYQHQCQWDPMTLSTVAPTFVVLPF